MVPNYDNLDESEIFGDEDDYTDEDDVAEEAEQQPSYTYRIKDDGTVSGMVDGLDAVKQAIRLILSIERYDYTIYSWDYGSEIKHLYGMPIDYCIPELERVVTEGLLRDDRIKAVGGFGFGSDKRSITITFTAHTIFGDIELEHEANV
ncbi:MAG: DUF2634 domain-containing protein [Clostridiales Family XIII bacterium]|jgi:hypothetical protein|nr:DUF2634 domain-containing protein [Clostridiales Family XIII bacterium]